MAKLEARRVASIQKSFADIHRFRKRGDRQHDLLANGLIVTIAVVIASLFLLPFTDLLSRSLPIAAGFMFLVFFFSACQLWFVYQIMRLLSLKSPDADDMMAHDGPRREIAEDGLSATVYPPKLD